jgi:hypothetical protein
MIPMNCLLLGNGVAIVVQTLPDEHFDIKGSDISVILPIEQSQLILDVNGVQIPFDIHIINHMINTGTSVYVYAGKAEQYTLGFVEEIILDRDMLLEAKGMLMTKMPVDVVPA